MSVEAGAIPSTEVLHFRVDGMRCDNCAAGIRRRLEALDGVVDARVSYALEDARVDNGCLEVLPGAHRGGLRSRYRREGEARHSVVECMLIWRHDASGAWVIAVDAYW